MTSSSIRGPSEGGAGDKPAARRALTRRRFAGLAGLTLAAGLAPGPLAGAAAGPGDKARHRRCRRPRPPRLPAGFNSTFESRLITAGGIRQHAVIGGEGPPLLLVHGWPENWYAWRLLMPALAEQFRIIAVDQRGIGMTSKPKGGYDTGTLADDLVALMDALGHRRFAVVGHDTGFVIGYALAADHPDRVDRIALLEVPGPPGATPSPPFFVPAPVNNKLWHIAVNRLEEVNEQLIRGREEIYFGYEFAIQAGKQLPDHALRYYVRLLKCDPDALRGSFGFYRALDTTSVQNERRSRRPLPMPVLAVGGAASFGSHVGESLVPLATDVRSLVIPDAGHWLAEEAPDEMLTALTSFLAPYRQSGADSARQPAAA